MNAKREKFRGFGIINGTSTEIRGQSNTSYYADDGFLRLSAGGGLNGNTKSYIDLSGYSTIPDMYLNIVFGIYGTERMRINSAGNVGIGTGSPTVKLEVNGNEKINGTIVSSVAGANIGGLIAIDNPAKRTPSLRRSDKIIKPFSSPRAINSESLVLANICSGFLKYSLLS